MSWRKRLLDNLAGAIPCGYDRPGAPGPATEPTCLAAIALAVCGRQEQSLPALQWLASIQNDDGSLGPNASLTSPGWPTALGILTNVYVACSEKSDVLGLGGFADRSVPDGFPFDMPRAIQWLLAAKGNTFKRTPDMGHDSMLEGWPWVVGTHSWIEPTALAVLALKSVGESDASATSPPRSSATYHHPRTREGVRLLQDRLLLGGGCNYGNTVVLGQTLRPHIQPTGLALLALYGETDDDGRIARSLDWLESEISGDTAAASLAYALIALARYGRKVPTAPDWLAAATLRPSTHSSPHRTALLLLASAALECDDSSSPSFSNQHLPIWQH